MKIKLSTRRNVAQTLAVIIIVLLIFVVVVGFIAYIMVKAVQKIVPPPPKDAGASWTQIEEDNPVGSYLAGGMVTGYFPTFAVQGNLPSPPPGFVIQNVYIYASDVPNPAQWTNLIYTVPFDQLQTVLGDNGLPVETFPNGAPSQRFYNFVVDGEFE